MTYSSTFLSLILSGFWSVTKNVDCLHYCVPGPIDQWTLFSYHAIISTANALGNIRSGGSSSDSNGGGSSSSSSSSGGTVELNTYIVSENLREGSTVKAAKRNAIYLIQNGSRRIFPHAVSE
jgi:hypothetical protein